MSRGGWDWFSTDIKHISAQKQAVSSMQSIASPGMWREKAATGMCLEKL